MDTPRPLSATEGLALIIAALRRNGTPAGIMASQQSFAKIDIKSMVVPRPTKYPRVVEPMGNAMASVVDTYVGTDVRVIGILAEMPQGLPVPAAYVVEKDNEPDRGPFPTFHDAMMVAFDVAHSAEA